MPVPVDGHGQAYACSYCDEEKIPTKEQYPGETDPVSGEQTIPTSCGQCGRKCTHYAVGRAARSIRALNESIGNPGSEPVAADGDGDGGDVDDGLAPEVRRHVAEIKSSGEARVREMAELEMEREEPRREIIAAVNQRLAEIEESEEGTEGEAGKESKESKESKERKEGSDSEDEEVEEPATGICPGCDSEVRVSVVFDRGSCPTPECGLSLGEILANTNTDADADAKEVY